MSLSGCEEALCYMREISLQAARNISSAAGMRVGTGRGKRANGRGVTENLGGEKGLREEWQGGAANLGGSEQLVATPTALHRRYGEEGL